MSRGISHAVTVGNEFVLPRQPLQPLRVMITEPEEVVPEPVQTASSVAIEVVPQEEVIPVLIASAASAAARQTKPATRLLNFAHQYSLGSFALLFLLVGSTGIIVGGRYWTSRLASQIKPLSATAPLTHTIAGLSLAVPNTQLQSELQSIASQSATITVGTQATPISPAVIRSWLTITPSGNKAQDYLQVNTQAISSSLMTIAKQYVVAPVNQVTLSDVNGSTSSQVVLAGKNGISLSDPNSLGTQAQQSAKSVMDAKGLNFNTPLQTVPFQAVTPCAFAKSLYADVSTDRLYAYQGCQLVNTFLTTDGKPGDTTPIGNFTIWDKTTLQTMVGPGYVQPNVPYINYFDHSGDAIHGNYWRPASVFGNTNTSHGCVGVQVPEAEWIYNWAPIGTPVVTYLD